VVQTVQAAAKHFEHGIQTPEERSRSLVESRMDGATGLAILLRNSPVRNSIGPPNPASPVVIFPRRQLHSLVPIPYSLCLILILTLPYFFASLATTAISLSTCFSGLPAFPQHRPA